MAYKEKSVKEIIQDIEGGKAYLPALQRKFVWSRGQIETLFDSILKEYPIGTFLFWKLKKEVANNYVFYEFLKDYDQRSPYNRKKTGSFLADEITGVLDGQQRLSSIYLGLQGTHTEKAPYMRWVDPNAYKKAQLYLNLLSLPFDVSDADELVLREDENFEFMFLTEQESKEWIHRTNRVTNEAGDIKVVNTTMYWFKVGDVLKWSKQPEFSKLINELSKTANISQKAGIESDRRKIEYVFTILNERFNKQSLINYFEVDKEDLEDILKIFIRVNSGGTQLSKTDLFFSTIVATWEDGRERIEELLKRINSKGNRFGFTNEFLMRCCLVLSDGPVIFKVNSFKSDNVQIIQKQWSEISKAVDQTVDLLVEFGFDESLLTSQNAVIVIAYYLFKGGKLDPQSKKQLQKYLIHALLNQIFGGSQDQMLSTLRNGLRKEGTKQLNSEAFAFESLANLQLPSRKTLYISEEQLDVLLEVKKGAYSFLILSLLYPQLKFNNVHFHQDHIHPYSGFSEENRLLNKVTEDEWKDWLDYRDMVPNLQLMEGRENESKNATAFKDWLLEKEPSVQINFKTSNFIPDVDLNFKNFNEFYRERRSLLRNKLKEVLAISSTLRLSDSEILEESRLEAIEN